MQVRDIKVIVIIRLVKVLEQTSWFLFFPAFRINSTRDNCIFHYRIDYNRAWGTTFFRWPCRDFRFNIQDRSCLRFRNNMQLPRREVRILRKEVHLRHKLGRSKNSSNRCVRYVQHLFTHTLFFYLDAIIINLSIHYSLRKVYKLCAWIKHNNKLRHELEVHRIKI